MRATHKLTRRKHASVEKAIRAHEAYTNYVVGEVDKVGIKEVLHNEEHAVLLNCYRKLLKFAEDCMIKQLPTEIQGDLNLTGNAYTDRLLERMALVNEN